MVCCGPNHFQTLKKHVGPVIFFYVDEKSQMHIESLINVFNKNNGSPYELINTKNNRSL